MRLHRWGLFGAGLSVLLLMACYGEPPATDGPGSFKVSFVDKPKLGTAKAPLDVHSAPFTYKIDIAALKEDGSPDTGFNGSVCVYSNRGVLVGAHTPLNLKGGQLKGASVRLKLAFGKTTLWVGEANKDGAKVEKCPNSFDPTDTTRPYVGRVGALPDIHFKPLSIRQLQSGTDSPYDSPLFKKYALIRSGRMVVTAVTSNGFHATDLDAFKDGKGFHSLFIFTFSAPNLAYEDGEIPKSLQIGDIVTQIEGGVDEFSGHTQITFPSFVPKWKDRTKGIVEQVPAKDFPKPIEISLFDYWSRRKMEPLESALVEIKDAIAIPFDLNQDGWGQFRQWPVLLVQAKDKTNQSKCEDLVRSELALHLDESKNKNSRYRSCLGQCQASFAAAKAKCKDGDEVCLSKATDGWFTCFFSTCRFEQENGLFARFDKEGCQHAIMLVISNATVPGYDPTTKEHLQRRFPSIKGILIQSRASGFYKLRSDQYDNEQSNNGYVIWVRSPDDLTLPKK